MPPEAEADLPPGVEAIAGVGVRPETAVQGRADRCLRGQAGRDPHAAARSSDLALAHFGVSRARKFRYYTVASEEMVLRYRTPRSPLSPTPQVITLELDKPAATRSRCCAGRS